MNDRTILTTVSDRQTSHRDVFASVRLCRLRKYANKLITSLSPTRLFRDDEHASEIERTTRINVSSTCIAATILTSSFERTKTLGRLEFVRTIVDCSARYIYTYTYTYYLFLFKSGLFRSSGDSNPSNIIVRIDSSVSAISELHARRGRHSNCHRPIRIIV